MPATRSPTSSFSEASLEPYRIGCRKSQVSERKQRPFLWRACIGFEQMRDGEARSKCRAMAAIKDKKLVGIPVVERVHDAAPQIFPGPGGAQPFTFDAEERDFVERIDHA